MKRFTSRRCILLVKVKKKRLCKHDQKTRCLRSLGSPQHIMELFGVTVDPNKAPQGESEPYQFKALKMFLNSVVDVHKIRKEQILQLSLIGNRLISI